MNLLVAYFLLNYLFIAWAWLALALTPVAIYLNIKKENAADPGQKKKFKKWGLVTLILGPVSLLWVVPILGLLRYFMVDLMVINY